MREYLSKNCIEMKVDKEGFWYPEVDKENVLNVDYVKKGVLF
ncbi:MAG: hypothetical protein ACLTAI_01380 [Thomasclavelia sp.]